MNLPASTEPVETEALEPEPIEPEPVVPSPIVPATEAASRLLHEVMGDPRFGDTCYLDWLYRTDHPVGPPVVVNVASDHDHGEPGDVDVHGAAVQQRVRRGDRVERMVLIVNVVVRPDSQGHGVYVQNVLDNAHQVIANGCVAGFGVTNERSTVPSIEALGGALVGPLPVRLCSPARLGRGVVETVAVDSDFLVSDRFEALARELDRAPADEWVQSWDAATLRWRLSRPDTPYVLHIGREVVAVSTRVTAWGLPLVVMLKLFPRGVPAGPLSGDQLVTAACLHHRAPLAIYAGLNRHVAVRGLRLPRRWLPAPLNLVCLSLSDLDQRTFRFETFEFLDFDAF